MDNPIKTWGYFDKDGKPIATGDSWWHWRCPNQEYEWAESTHPITGEFYDGGYVAIPCPMKNVAVKLERCEKCGIEFRYP